MSDGHLLLAAGSFMAAALVASLLAARVRVPGLVLFLGLGMAVGTDGTGWVDFTDYRLARSVGVVALALILFEGGLTSGLPEVRPVMREAASLALVGTVVTAVVAGLAAAWLLDFTTLEGLLLGAILSATDSAAIFALLRHSTLERRLARTLEGESGFNDPVSVLLVLGFIAWLRDPGYGVADMALLFVRQLGIGTVVGVAVGWLAVHGMRRARLATAGLYPVATLATVALAYGAADSLHGSGFLAVYLAGLVLGTATIPARQTVTNFHQGMGWLAQLTLFVVLGLLVFPSQLGDVAVEGTVLALVVVFVARPLAALLATLPFRFNARERVLLGWAGLRGAVPVVLATFPVIDHVPHSLAFFNLVFFVVLVSTLMQGATFEALARRLGLTTSHPALPRPLAEAGTIRRLGAEGKVIGGFAGATADAFTLFERLEKKLEQYNGQLMRAAVELAKDWRTDKYLRNLEAMMIVADAEVMLILTGNGDVLEPEGNDGNAIAAIGSGGNYALAAAKALADYEPDPEKLARRAMAIAAEVCVFTNDRLTIEEVGA